MHDPVPAAVLGGLVIGAVCAGLPLLDGIERFALGVIVGVSWWLVVEMVFS